ncbi:MAG: TPM domain-containing protein [Alphaproteobacteria bacterium]|nr:TPM domain-containing protein [Alphaproteobacteria bacterium]
MKIKYVFALLVALVMPLMVQAVQFPQLSDQIVDDANVLSSLQKTQIMQNLSGLTSQVVVASVRSMNGMEIEEYANRLFNHWGIGDKDKNDGILILIAPNQRQLRIEVGYGMEHILTDALASQIVNQNMLPHAKQGHYGSALVDASLMVRTVLEGKVLPVSSDMPQPRKKVNVRINGTPVENIEFPPDMLLRIGLGLAIIFGILGFAAKKITAATTSEGVAPVLDADIKKSRKERAQFSCMIFFFSLFYGIFFIAGLFLMTQQILFGIFLLLFSTVHSLLMIYGRAIAAWHKNKYFPITAMGPISSGKGRSSGGFSGGGRSSGGFSSGGGRSGGGGSSGRW